MHLIKRVGKLMWNFIYNEMKKNKDSVVFDKSHKYTYNEIISLVEEKANYLRNKLPEKSKCGILCEKGINTSIAILACWKANLIPIVMSFDYGDRHWERIIALTQPDIVIKDNEKKTIYRSEFLFTENRFLGNFIRVIPDNTLDKVALIMCTSGTTGNPKGVLITTEALQKNVLSICKYFEIHSDDKILIARPLYHCAVLTGEFLVGLFKGCDIGFFDEKYQPTQVLQFCVKNHISVLCGTPTLFNHLAMIIQRMNINHAVRTIALSGECLSRNVAEKIRMGFEKTKIYNVYGLTEAAPRVCYLPPEKFDEYPESVGIPIESVEVKIVNEKGKDLLALQQGEIWVKTPCVMKGYYHDQKQTADKIKGEWLLTGDIGFLDNQGYLYILSRKDDLIIKGGMNIYPKEIENQVLQLHEIKECVAYGIKKFNFQEIGMDVVLDDQYCNMGKKELLSLLGNELPGYQMPSQINIVKELKRNASGKIVRNYDGGIK